MSIELRLPDINAQTERGQLAQIKSYLFQFAEQLQWALNTIEKGTTSESIVLQDKMGNILEETKEATAYDTFNSIKDLIIKSADIVEAYYEKIDNLLELDGKYVAQADFGDGGVATYIKDTSASISATSEYVQQKFTKTETIDGVEEISEYSLKDLDSRIRKQEGTIRSGNVKTTLTTDGETIGIEIGEIDTINNVTKSRYATFSAAGIELYDGSINTQPVAYISKSKIYITSAEFISGVKMGKYKLDFSNGIAFKWEEA
jgi:hypothetical protein